MPISKFSDHPYSCSKSTRIGYMNGIKKVLKEIGPLSAKEIFLFLKREHLVNYLYYHKLTAFLVMLKKKGELFSFERARNVTIWSLEASEYV